MSAWTSGNDNSIVLPGFLDGLESDCKRMSLLSGRSITAQDGEDDQFKGFFEAVSADVGGGGFHC